jgi:hypothetical protein
MARSILADEIDNLTAEQEHQRFGNRDGLQLLGLLDTLQEEVALLRDRQYNTDLAARDRNEQEAEPPL